MTPSDTWTFKAGTGTRQVRVKPRLSFNAIDAAIDSALAGRGITRVLWYQVERELRAGRLVRLLRAFEPDPLPVHVVHAASAPSAKVRAFMEVAVPRLRRALGDRSSKHGS